MRLFINVVYFHKFVILGSTWRGKFVIVSKVEKPVRLLKWSLMQLVNFDSLPVIVYAVGFLEGPLPHAQLSLHDVSPVCVPSWDSCREMRLASTSPHCSRTVVDPIFLTFVRRGSTEKHFFFYCLDVAVHVRQLPWDHCGLKACPFYVAGQSMAQCDLCNLPTWTSLGRWVSFMLNLHNLSCAPSPT